MKPLNYLTLTVLFLVMYLATGPSYAQSSGYYEIPETGRPRSVFSICCCKKTSTNDQGSYYRCGYIEENTCPDETKQYKLTLNDCPSGLMYTKY